MYLFSGDKWGIKIIQSALILPGSKISLQSRKSEKKK